MEELQGDALVEQFARIAWSCLIEPGDQSAAIAIQTLGAIHALEMVASQAAATDIVVEYPDLLAALNEAFVNGQKTLADALERWRPRLVIDEIGQLIQRHKQIGGRLTTCVSTDWPTGLADLGLSSPLALWCHGNVNLLRARESVAIIGSRIATAYGEAVTSDIVSDFATAGVAILSGGAFGIDSAAHRSALALQSETIAVLAGGSDRFYPSGNRTLLEQIRLKGLIVTEMPPGAMPTKWRFLQRNRLVAALSCATVVVEAGWRSGSINTANHAEQIGRQVFAVPGSITSPASAGCHRLIRDGKATLITSGQDVLEDLGWAHSGSSDRDQDLSANERRAMDALSRSPRQFSEIMREAGLTAHEAQAALGSLLLQGLATQDSAGWRL